jgi:hypothetical protein
MIESSLDRLKKDYNELQKFMKRLERDGEQCRIPLVQDKMKFLVARISVLEERKT